MTGVEKKMWAKPKLKVFVRTTAAEAVLWLCKMDTSGFGFGIHHNGCYSSCVGHVRCQDGSGS
jgi:hypothetical protein